MVHDGKERKKAIRLRKKGISYSEILKQVPVAKSTLSLWLRNVGLAKRQKQRLTKKKLATGRRGREQRLAITERIKKKAREDITRISKRDLWMIGIALYRGEGNKGASVKLGNSDPFLIKIFLKWLIEICNVPREDIYFLIFLHDNNKHRLKEVQEYWSRVTGFHLDSFKKVSWKKNKIRTTRKNTGNDYYGLLRVIVKRSTSLNRKIQGWIEGVCEQCGVV